MKKNGFTLVELMVVVAVIGILAAVSLPRFQTAADKARIAETPKVLSAIAGAQEAHRIAHGRYVTLTTNHSADWTRLGFNQLPDGRYFRYSVAATAGVLSTSATATSAWTTPPTFTATATLIRNLSRARVNETIQINHCGNRSASDELRRLIPSFGATGATLTACPNP